MAKSTVEQRSRWQRELEAWRASGKPLSAFARERGLSRDALEYWKRRLVAPSAPTLKLIAVAPARCVASSQGAPIELLIGPARLVLAPGFDGETLVRVLDVLGRRC